LNKDAEAAYHFDQAAALDPEKYKDLSKEAISSLIQKLESENSKDDLIMQLPERYEKAMKQINKPARDIIEREFKPIVRAIIEKRH
jgi:hypothetical protein